MVKDMAKEALKAKEVDVRLISGTVGLKEVAEFFLKHFVVEVFFH